MTFNPLSLQTLQAGPSKPLLEVLQCARKLISDRTGIISRVEFEDLIPGEPKVYFARSTPANMQALSGRETLNFGDSASVDSNRAIMKAIGETIERYCPAFYNKDDLQLSTYESLNGEGVHPEKFPLFSQKQYSEPGFPFSSMETSTPMRWVTAYSITHDRPVLVPASFVYIPYQFDPLEEPKTHYPISSGLACHGDFASAMYKGILEVIERDGFMIIWQNQISCSQLDLSSVKDPMAQSLLNVLGSVPATCQAYIINLDIKVAVILVLLRSSTGQSPFTVMGISADLNPQQALLLALEEASLSFIGMSRYARTQPDYVPQEGYKDVTSLILHGLAHAVYKDLGKSLEFLNTGGDQVSIEDLKNRSSDNMVNNVQTLLESLEAEGYDVIAKDLTTVDIDEAGFKVVRVLVPGMQPLDVNHARRYLGGKRLYEVPCKLGLFKSPLSENDLNPYPHMFP